MRLPPAQLTATRLGGHRAGSVSRAPRGAQERLAAEFAHRFSTEHTALRDDEDFWRRAAAHFSDELLADLAISCALWVGMGRMRRTLDIEQACVLTLPARA